MENTKDIKPGTKVILGKHQHVSGSNTAYWGPGMEQYVGKEATIIRFDHTDPWGMHCYAVDIDYINVWRAVNMTLVGAPYVKPSAVAYGIACKRCHEYYEHAEVKPDFICYGCRH